MFRQFYLILSIIILASASSYAHPPAGIDLQYDSKNEVLMVDVNHLSRDHRRHYIQEVEVRVNDSAPIVKTFRQQIQPNSMFVDIPLKAEEGDTISVTAFSREGGTKEASIEITKALLEEGVVPRKEFSRAVSTTPSDKSKIRPAISTDPDISKPAIPTDRTKQRPAVTRNPAVAQPAVSMKPSVTTPAVARDPSTAKSPHPDDPSKLIPAAP